MWALLGVACELLVAAYLWDLVPRPGPLNWESGVLSAGPPGKSREKLIFNTVHLSTFLL